MKSVAHSCEALLPFEILLEHLQRQGFRIGVEHHLRLRALLAEFADNCAPSELKTLLCPLFATNAEQQESFYRAFDLYYPLLTGGSVGVDQKGRVETNVAAKELTPPAHRARRRAYLAVAVGAVVLLVGLLSWKTEAWWHKNPNQLVQPLPEPSDAAAGIRSRRARRPLVGEADSIPPDLAVSRSPESQSLPWGRIALIVTLLSWLAYELYLYRGHRLLIRRKRGQTPPYSWPIRADTAPDLYEPQELALVTQLLHRRYLGEAERLDLAATVEASVAALGFPTLRYRKDSRLPEYLFLIDRASVRDHQAHLYDHLATKLREQGLYLSAYFYEGDPRVCWDSAGDYAVTLDQLQRSYAGYRLVLLGNGEQLLDSMSGRLAPWHDAFSTWTDRAVLTPEAPAQWGLREMTLATKFAVAPATLEGLATLPAYFELASLIDPRGWSERDGEDGATPERTIDAMRRYLGEDTFQWLCACAIYPELHWDLTLQIAALPSMAPGLVCEENLVKLLRLEWFRSGSMPDNLRRELIARLDPRVQREARQAIVGLLENSPPPTGTFAENVHRFQIAYQRYWSNPRDRAAKRGLRTALNNLGPDDPTRDYASLDASDSVISSPLQLVLPNRLRKMIYPAVSPLWIRTAVRMILALLLVLAVPQSRQLILGWTLGSAKSTAGLSRNAKFVAILPFRTLGEDPSLDDAANGIVEALSARLFQLKDIHLATPSAAAKVNPKDPMAQIAQSLGVKLLVRGSVQGSGDRMAIVVSLDEAATGRRIWSQEFSGLKQDLLTLQDQIYSGLLSAFDLKLSNEELAKGTGRFTENVGAYELYLKGRSLLRSGQRDEKTLQQALALFDGATLKDPGFTLAYTGIADTCRYLYTLKKDGSWANRGLGAANRAQGLNDNLPEVHTALGSLYTATGKNAEAVSELKRALELAPNSDDGYVRLGRAYLNMGQKAEALDAFQHAIDANPYYWSNYNMLGVAHYRFGDNAAALKAFQRVTELDPRNPNGWSNIGLVTQHEGNWSEVLPEFRKALELQPSVENYSNLGTAYFFLGKYEDALANFSKASEISPQQAVYIGFLADCYRRMGQAAKARQTYDRAISLTYQALQTNPRDAKPLDDLAVYYAKEGDTTRGLEFIRRAREIDASDVDLLYDEAVINTLANRMPEALRNLQETLTKGYAPRAILSDPDLTPLRQQPDFQTMLQKFQPKTGS